MAATIWSVGHSTRSLSELVEIISAFGIETLADVRRYPGSRRLPHFHEEALRDGLAPFGIAYEWIPELGGRRKNVDEVAEASGWKHPAFRAYASHIRTAEFARGFAKLIELAEQRPTVMMCSEALWWRCHRRIVADVLVARGIPVIHIMSERKSQPHVLRPPARLVDGRLEYPPAPPDAPAGG